MKCWKCNQEIGTGGCACDRIRCTLASWSVSATPDNSKTDRIAELEAENEKLRAERIDMLLHPEKYFSCYRDLKVVAAENAALRAEFDHAVRINNPCEHTGWESFVCDICGYPDPRKVIAALRAERDRMKAALMDIASAGCNEACEWLENDCDKCMLETAQQALRGEVIL